MPKSPTRRVSDRYPCPRGHRATAGCGSVELDLFAEIPDLFAGLPELAPQLRNDAVQFLDTRRIGSDFRRHLPGGDRPTRKRILRR